MFHRNASRLLAFGLFAAVSAIALYAAPAARAEDINVGNYESGTNGFPWAVAMEEGFFKKYGLNITGIRNASGGQAIRQVIAGDLLFGDGALTEVIEAQAAGAEVQAISADMENSATTIWAVLPDSPIKDRTKDLKGKKWSFSNPGAITQAEGAAMIKQLGYKPNVDVIMVPTGTFPAGMTLLEKGGVDVAILPGPLYAANKNKVRVIARVSELPVFNNGVGYATAKMMKERPDALKGILMARRDAVKLIYSDPKRAAADIAKQIKQPVADIEEQLLIAIAPAATVDGVRTYGEGAFYKKSLEGSVTFARELGHLKEEIDWNKVVNLSFLPPDQAKILP